MVVQEEETESAQALKLIQHLQREQESHKAMPEYERAVLRRNQSHNLPMDDLNFSAEEILVVEGSSYLNFPLNQVMNEHYLTKASLTTVVRELNLAVKPPIQSKDDCHEIFGFCDVKGSELKRLVFKTDSDVVKDIKVSLQRSLARKCQVLSMRTDLQTMGIYLMKHWVLKFMCEYEQGEETIEFTNFGDEFVSFMARNQFK